jgi:hypothetical protein
MKLRFDNPEIFCPCYIMYMYYSNYQPLNLKATLQCRPIFHEYQKAKTTTGTFLFERNFPNSCGIKHIQYFMFWTTYLQFYTTPIEIWTHYDPWLQNILTYNIPLHQAT